MPNGLMQWNWPLQKHKLIILSQSVYFLFQILTFMEFCEVKYPQHLQIASFMVIKYKIITVISDIFHNPLDQQNQTTIRCILHVVCMTLYDVLIYTSSKIYVFIFISQNNGVNKIISLEENNVSKLKSVSKLLITETQHMR